MHKLWPRQFLPLVYFVCLHILIDKIYNLATSYNTSDFLLPVIYKYKTYVIRIYENICKYTKKMYTSKLMLSIWFMFENMQDKNWFC